MHLRVGDQDTRVLDLAMRDIYADVIEGVPNAKINAGIIDSALQNAKRRHGLSPHLIPPVARPLPSRHEPKEALPSICCMARVRGAALDPEANHAEASLVWFQNTVSTTVDPTVAELLRGVKWAEIAKDDDW